MQQLRGITSALAVRTSAPAANGDGTALTAWDAADGGLKYRSERFLVKFVVSGGSAAFALYANESLAPTAAVWGIPVDSSGNLGLIGGGITFAAGTYYFYVEDIAPFAEVCLVRTSGTGTATATITNVIERSALR